MGIVLITVLLVLDALLHEAMSVPAMIGAALVIGAMIVSELKPRKA